MWYSRSWTRQARSSSVSLTMPGSWILSIANITSAAMRYDQHIMQTATPQTDHIEQRYVYANRPRLPPRIQHHIGVLPPRIDRTPRSNRTNERRSELSNGASGKQVGLGGRSGHLKAKGISIIAELGQHTVLRDECEKGYEHQRSIH